MVRTATRSVYVTSIPYDPGRSTAPDLVVFDMMMSSDPSPVAHAYQDVDTLKNSDGIVAVISQRRRDGGFTVGCFYEFVRDGKPQRTAFMPEHLLPSYARMIGTATDRIAQLKLRTDLPFEIRDAR